MLFHEDLGVVAIIGLVLCSDCQKGTHISAISLSKRPATHAEKKRDEAALRSVIVLRSVHHDDTMAGAMAGVPLLSFASGSDRDTPPFRLVSRMVGGLT